MAIEALGAVTSTSSTATAASSVSLEDFVRILVSQLNNQDPLKPMDNQEFVTQLAQFTSLEQSRQMNANLESLLSVQSTTQSVGLIGKTVSVQSDSGLVSGQVTMLSFTSGEPRLTVQNLPNGPVFTDIRISQITSVR